MSGDRGGMRHQVSENERPENDLFLTPQRAVEQLARDLRVSGFDLLWDPCASGAAPWTVGDILGKAWGIRTTLSDLSPGTRVPGIYRRNYLETPRPRVPGAVLQVSNLPYRIIDRWLSRWDETAREGDAAIWLVAFDSIPVKKDRKQAALRGWIQPDQRFSFLLPEEVALATGRNKKPKPRPDGLVDLGATGKSHGWGIWIKGGVPTPRVFSINGDIDLHLVPGELRAGRAS